MKTTVVALREASVQVAVGSAGKKPAVSALYAEPAFDGGIAAWEKAAGKLWQANKLPKSGLRVVLPDHAVTMRMITAPDLPKKQLDALVDHEMTTRGEEPVAADYQILGTDGAGKLRLLACACRRSVMEEYLAMFSRLGLRVSSVTMALAGYIRLLAAMDAMRGRTCIWLLFERGSVLSLLVENGAYRYSGRTQIFSETGTLDFAAEVARNVSGTVQFHTANRSEHTIDAVCYAGCDDGDFAVCAPELAAMGLRAEPLPTPDCLRALPGRARMGDWIDCVSALLR